jgi:hypothetical protein
MRLCALAAMVAVCAITAVSAEIGPLTDVASRTNGAARVVVARIADVQARFATNEYGDQLIVSTAVLEVLETLKGSQSATLRVAVEGGTVGDLTLKVSDLPAVRTGERAVFFLDDAPGGEQRPHQRGRGILKLTPTDQISGSTATLDSVRQQVRAAQGLR